MLDSPSGGSIAASQLPGDVSRFSPQREHGFCREEHAVTALADPRIYGGQILLDKDLCGIVLISRLKPSRHETEPWRISGRPHGRRPPSSWNQRRRRWRRWNANRPGPCASRPPLWTAANAVESLHPLLTMVAEIGQTGDSIDRALLDELTSDRSDMMDGIRKQLLAEAAGASAREAEPAP